MGTYRTIDSGVNRWTDHQDISAMRHARLSETGFDRGLLQLYQ